MHPVAIYHLCYNSAQNDQSSAYVGINRLRWYRKPMTAADRFATTPNATTLYGVAMLDLSKEPVVVTVPEVRDHYWSIQFADNYARWWPMMIGSQFNAPGAMKRLLIGPNWSRRMPAGFVGAEITQSPSDIAAVTARVALTDDTAEELKLVNGIQDGYHERTAFERFARLGLKAGTPFDPSSLSPAIAAAVGEGIEDGRVEVQALMARGSGIERNGWALSSDLGYRDSDWLERARYGLIAALGPVPSRSHTAAFCPKHSAERPLSGQNQCTITFDLNDLPPVTEFWEIPLYEREGYFVDNPINRYSINSYMLKRGKLHTEGGKLVIYVQSQEPKEASHRQNWLPSPKSGGFQFAARFYGPGTALIDGSYNMPGVVATVESGGRALQ